jgi:hypothetical protein
MEETESWVKPGFDEMLKGYAEYLGGTLTYVKHPTGEDIHTYYLNFEEDTVIVTVTTVPTPVARGESSGMN